MVGRSAGSGAAGADGFAAGPGATPQLTLEGLPLPTLVAGVVMMASAYVGFEGLTALSKETQNPTRTVPRIINAVIVIILVVELFSVVATLPLMTARAEDLYAGLLPNRVLANAGGVPWLGAVGDGIVGLAFLASSTGFLTLASRIAASATQQRMLPPRSGEYQLEEPHPGARCGGDRRGSPPDHRDRHLYRFGWLFRGDGGVRARGWDLLAACVHLGRSWRHHRGGAREAIRIRDCFGCNNGGDDRHHRLSALTVAVSFRVGIHRRGFRSDPGGLVGSGRTPRAWRYCPAGDRGHGGLRI
ncbi:APC family permease [Mycobacterium sp. CBMA293]|nr:APC family permease [Mycolicibacterium sp. CBMA 360]MUL62570.1 APC family permease [Mycolicibacterium sp. CBMA 335]MUL69022.1 APC family permease [Mycolicibacterium sp. CBMA 311]MUL96961.1 APC family permease [Mycolicibacterium sp. CBMA 230]MUM13434.1 APC family permease [Mycolicibacterium sp. CBMA 293]MUM30457.1 APC family permease [Mycolicibacterium sp. CBMA 361]